MIGISKDDVISNIKKATETGELNKKVEMGDPILTKKHEEKILESYIMKQDKISYKLKTKIILNKRKIADVLWPCAVCHSFR